MKFGFCTGEDGIEWAVKAGCDYLEFNLTAVSGMTDEAFSAMIEKVKACGLPVEAMNCFIPGDYAICDAPDAPALKDYLHKSLGRAGKLGTKVVVFGSGRARHIPEGMDKEEALKRIASFLNIAAPIAAENGVTIVIEPLCYAEDNAVNTFLDGVSLMKRVDLPQVAVLADLYHMGQNGEDVADLTKAGGRLSHCHIGRPGSRKYPMPDDGYDYAPFFRTLKEIGYDGRVSVEASFINGPQDLVDAVAYERKVLSEC